MNNQDELHEECGVFGVFGHKNAASICYYGLHSLQHRGQEAAGICVTNNEKLYIHKGEGLVTEVFDNQRISQLEGDAAIGHVRYSTAGDSIVQNAQPLVSRYLKGALAISHNGNLVNAYELREKFEAYKRLANKPDLDVDDYEKIADLELYLDEIPDYLALKLTTEYQSLKAKLRAREA